MISELMSLLFPLLLYSIFNLSSNLMGSLIHDTCLVIDSESIFNCPHIF